MNFELQRLYLDGEALTTEQLADAPRYVGRLVLERWSHSPSLGKSIREARFLDMALLDAMIVGMVDGKITLYGYEMHHSVNDGTSYQHIQCWELTPAAHIASY